MPDQVKAGSPVEALRRHGEVALGRAWTEGTPDYAATYGLTESHIPELIDLATTWVEEQPDNIIVYGPVHAWRALAQMKAEEAVRPLLDVMDELHELDDDWYLEEFPYVFGMIGTASIEPLATYLADDTYGSFPRINAGSGLRHVGIRNPESRDAVVAVLTRELDRHQPDGELNAFLVSDLMSLEARESGLAIERAFAENVVDPTVVGDWGDVRSELGIDGLGLAPDRTPGWPTLRERMDIPDELVLTTDSEAEERQLRREQQKAQKAKRQAKAKKKQQRKNKKRGRKPR